jgi:hypothetical protein
VVCRFVAATAIELFASSFALSELEVLIGKRKEAVVNSQKAADL